MDNIRLNNYLDLLIIDSPDSYTACAPVDHLLRGLTKVK